MPDPSGPKTRFSEFLPYVAPFFVFTGLFEPPPPLVRAALPPLLAFGAPRPEPPRPLLFLPLLLFPDPEPADPEPPDPELLDV